MAKQNIGRPSKFKKEYCKQLIDHMAKGLSYEAFAADLDVTRDCLYKWEKSHPDFLYSKKVGQEKLTKLLETMGLQLAAGKLKGNVTAWIFLCKNKIGYTDKIEQIGVANNEITLKYSLDTEPEKLSPKKIVHESDDGEEN